MEKFNLFLIVSCISCVLAAFKSIFGSIETSYMILLALLILDTLTGIAVAIKYNKFSSRGLARLLKKVITYSTAIFTVKLLEIGTVAVLKTTILSQITIIFLEVTETISILENLSLLGVPLPSNFINLLIKHINIPGLSKAIKMSKTNEGDLSEIEDIIKYQLPSFDDNNIRTLLQIKFKVWKSVIFQLNNIFKNNGEKTSEHIYYRVMSIIELGFKEMEEQWEEAQISKECINKFNKMHRPKVDKWFRGIKDISYSDISADDKRKKIIDSIIVILYKTIIDAHKICDKD